MSSRRVISIHTFSPAVALPPVTRPLLNVQNDGRSERLRQAVGVAGQEARNIDAEPDALGGIASLGRIRRLRNLGLRCTQAASQGIWVWFQREPERRVDEPAVCLGQTQVLRVPRVDQRIDQNAR